MASSLVSDDHLGALDIARLAQLCERGAHAGDRRVRADTTASAKELISRLRTAGLKYDDLDIEDLEDILHKNGLDCPSHEKADIIARILRPSDGSSGEQLALPASIHSHTLARASLCLFSVDL